MPPKKEKEKAAPKPVVIGEYDLTGMNKPELQSFVLQLQAEVEKSRQARNAVQVERDEVHKSLECYKREIQTKENEILLKEHEIEEATKEFEKLMSERKQKEKFLRFEHKRKFKEKVHLAANEKQEMFNQSNSTQTILLKDLKDKEVHICLTEKQYEKTLENVDAKRKMHLNESLINREDKLKNAIQDYEKMYEDLNNNIMLLKDVAVHELGELKTSEYEDYRTKYMEDMKQMKEHFKTTIGRSLSLIDTLKKQIQELNTSKKEMTKLREEILKENAELEPYCRELRTAKINASHYDQDKKSDAFTNKRIKEYQKRIRELNSENDVLEKTQQKSMAEAEMFRVKYVSSLRIIADSLSVKKEILERKIGKVLSELKQTGVNIKPLQLQEVDNKELLNFLKHTQ